MKEGAVVGLFLLSRLLKYHCLDRDIYVERGKDALFVVHMVIGVYTYG